MKGIIIAAGYGTRFLPATKTVPKEMFPLIDKPAIDFIVDEFIQSGIKEILIVSSRRKKSLEDYFDREIELETFFKEKNQLSKTDRIKPADASFYFLRQKEMLGTGHAILSCKGFIGTDSFVVAYPDDLVFSDIPLSKQLIELHNKIKGSILSAQFIETDVSRYGVIDFEDIDNIKRVKRIIEKPPVGQEPSKLISVGRYLFTGDIFPLLEKDFKEHKGGEFYHINAINTLASAGKVYALSIQGERMDVGDKIGYVESILRYGLMRRDLKDDIKELILRLSKNYDNI